MGLLNPKVPAGIVRCGSVSRTQWKRSIAVYGIFYCAQFKNVLASHITNVQRTKLVFCVLCKITTSSWDSSWALNVEKYKMRFKPTFSCERNPIISCIILSGKFIEALTIPSSRQKLILFVLEYCPWCEGDPAMRVVMESWVKTDVSCHRKRTMNYLLVTCPRMQRYGASSTLSCFTPRKM